MTAREAEWSEGPAADSIDAAGPPDHEVIAAVLGGDREQYAVLVRRHQQAAWRIAYGLVGNMDDARELSQNGFVKAYHALARFRGASKFSTWLYRIVVNECKDALKQRRRQPATVSLMQRTDEGEEVLFEVPDDAANPRDATAGREFARHLSAAIRRLAPQQHEAFVLHHLHGMSLEETAAVMGCRVGTVKAHVFRACAQLRQRLGSSVERWETGT